MKCPDCGEEGVPRVASLPTTFYIRITGRLRRGAFDCEVLPRFEEHRATKYIQYH